MGKHTLDIPKMWDGELFGWQLCVGMLIWHQAAGIYEKITSIRPSSSGTRMFLETSRDCYAVGSDATHDVLIEIEMVSVAA